MRAGGSPAPGAAEVEVFAWATDDDPDQAAEKAAVDALGEVFAQACPGHGFVNPVVAGGGTPDPRRVLRSRLRENDPPDSFQAHPGGELADHIDAGHLTALDDRFVEWGLVDVLPRGLLDALTVDGKIYTVPAGVHRLMLWGNGEVLARAGLTGRPATLDEFVRDLDALRSAGVEHPLALGAAWTQLELLEGVLLSELGPERFESLWAGESDWSGRDIGGALDAYGTLLSYTNPDRDDLHWPEAAKLLSGGAAGYLFMGDWVVGALEEAGLGDCRYQPFPGTAGTFQWLGDAFVLPRGAPNPEGAHCWLRAVGSIEGQKAFNTRKGSIPVRTDADPADYPEYQRAAIADLERARLVPSCAHGSACAPEVTAAVTGAVGRFSGSGDVAALRADIAAGVAGRGPDAAPQSSATHRRGGT
ncbi:ABC transporter substrate-binding protein [Nocardiopsis sp. YSL2]|uniref:ABC transporter substrate-binding protein n=1 Tax=Nocardiopsis sp. YSL2 TaxID=2939492 RepID=UPI0026F46C82|nr:ABC transporter substrate-binding protein [Nocardiopsis sp. YSL2]